MNAPKISVIIPLYNSEKYIRQCLVSVLASKFTDYELLVVDDHSTDNSLAEVKKLLPHFNGRMKILSTEKNSGGSGVPRNVGIENAAGKYVTFIDHDDIILPDALELFYNTAEIYNADVVHAERYFIFMREFNGKNLIAKPDEKGRNFVDKPTLEPVDLGARMNHFVSDFHCMPWSKFFRRDFLLENKLRFPNGMQMGEDVCFCFKCLCLAKNYILVPYITNAQRVGTPSASRVSVKNKSDGTRLFLSILFSKVGVFDEFMNGLEFFQNNPAYHRKILKYIIENHLKFLNLFNDSEPHAIQKFLFDGLQNPQWNSAAKDIVAAHFYTEYLLRMYRRQN